MLVLCMSPSTCPYTFLIKALSFVFSAADQLSVCGHIRCGPTLVCGHIRDLANDKRLDEPHDVCFSHAVMLVSDSFD